MDKGPLVTEEIEGAARFLAEFNKCYLVESAFWLKKEETHNGNLYIVSDQITDENFDLAYDAAARISIELPNPWFDGMQVKVRGGFHIDEYQVDKDHWLEGYVTVTTA